MTQSGPEVETLADITREDVVSRILKLYRIFDISNPSYKETVSVKREIDGMLSTLPMAIRSELRVYGIPRFEEPETDFEGGKGGRRIKKSDVDEVVVVLERADPKLEARASASGLLEHDVERANNAPR